MDSLSSLVLSLLFLVFVQTSSVLSANDDNLIKFSNYMFKFKIYKNHSDNALIGMIPFSKPLEELNNFSSSNYDFSLIDSNTNKTSDIFRVEITQTGVEIRLNQTLSNSYEPKNYLKLHAARKIEGQRLTKCYVIIYIADTDVLKVRAPIFRQHFYEAQIYEQNAPDSLLLKVEALDEFDSTSSNITYQLLNNNMKRGSFLYNASLVYSNAFQIKSETGEIYVKRILNREQKDFFVLNVIAIDNRNKKRTSAQVFVRVMPQNELLKPHTQADVFNLSLAETSDFTKKPIIFRLNATDLNLKDDTKNLIFSLHGSLNDLNTFEIDSLGNIRLVSKLNYDIKSAYSLTMIIRDMSLPSSTTHAFLNIKIENTNFQAPAFQASFYEFILFENASLNQKVGRVSAYYAPRSSSKNKHISYALYSNFNRDLDINDQFPFLIDAKNGTILTNQKGGRFASQNYEFYVSAFYNLSGKNTSSNVKVKIRILSTSDLNVPEFGIKSYNLNISEEIAIGLPLVTLNIVNRDANSYLEYSIESESSLIDESQATIFSLVKQTNTRVFLTLDRANLNYKKKSMYNLNVKCIDQDGLYSYAHLQINVLPNLNFSPRFSKDIFAFDLYENAKPGTFVGRVSALALNDFEQKVTYKLFTNAETLTNIQMSLFGSFGEISSNQYSDFGDFRLDEQTGNLYVSGTIDREKYDKTTLYITASYRDRPNTRIDHALIQLNILDANDNYPQFTRKQYNTQIYMNTPLNAYLLRVQANDLDAGENGQVEYSIDFMNEQDQHLIKIDQNTGIIRLVTKLSDYSPLLNRNNRDMLNLSITAKDLGSPSLHSKAIVHIKFNYFDDQPPVFEYKSYVFDFYEKQPLGTKIGRVMAHDPDQSPSSAALTFKLLDHNSFFKLESSGFYNSVWLSSKFIANFDTDEKKVYNLTLRAYSDYLFTDTCIIMNVKNLNDHKIKLEQSNFKIVFNNYKNYFLTEQSARFLPLHQQFFIESELKNYFKFSLADSIGKQLVNLNQKTGELRLKPILNSNNQINATFSMKIYDEEQELESTCELNVIMLSDNLITESVALNIDNINLDLFLNKMYNKFVESLMEILPASVKKSNIHLLSVLNTTTGVNVTLSVSIDYEKDLYMSSRILKQVLYSKMHIIEQNLLLSPNRISILEDKSCSIEPCLNYQQCLTNVKFMHADSSYTSSGLSLVQFRSVQVKHDFSCSCPTGFTGKNASFTCDLEINLCYSNPCGQNGVCVSLESDYYCVCEPDYTGRMCEYSLKEDKCCDLALQNAPFLAASPSKTLTNNTSNSNQTIDKKCIPLSRRESICKSGSTCKNLILGGVICDSCPQTKHNSDLNQFYNEFCELRSRHFPQNKLAFLTLPGIQNRLRFKLKFSFSTFKSDAYLFYNGRLELKTDKSVFDFIALKIRNDYLVFKYSLGDKSKINEIKMDRVSVSDGKWRTFTLEYVDRNLTLSLDDDMFDSIDSCALSSENKLSESCYRVNHYFELHENCSFQSETCFRFFDLNGPFVIGRKDTFVAKKTSEENKSNFEGCISDFYINEKLINLEDDVLINYNTEIGCLPKIDQCVSKQISPCKHLWGNEYKTNDLKDNSESQIFGLTGNGYISLAEKHISSSNTVHLEFFVKMNSFKENPSNVTLVYIQLNTKAKQISLNLVYDQANGFMKLISENENNLELGSIQNLNINRNNELNDLYWNKIELSIDNKSLIELKINNVYSKQVNFATYFQLFEPNFGVKFYLGGFLNNFYSNLNACLKNVRVNFQKAEILFDESINIKNECSLINSTPAKTDDQNSGLKMRQMNNLICGKDRTESPCFNNGSCFFIPSTNYNQFSFNCTCSIQNYRGKLCQYEKKKFNFVSESCPAKWWGKEAGICGPCECDESKNFSPDCNKTTGQCLCKPNYYKKFNSLKKEWHCVPCDCHLEGSSSLQCDETTGQCRCLTGAGITGRRCDRCVSPYAEMNSTLAKCLQVNTRECPKTYSFNTWWPRTAFNTVANFSCPKGSIGTAYRSCSEINGWLNNIDLSECQSLRLIDSQLVKWSEQLYVNNRTQLNSYQAFKLVQDLNKITLEAEFDQDELNDLDILSEDSYFLSTSTNTLYAFDLIVIKNITRAILEYELENAPSFLYLQDKHFLNDLFSIINRMLNKKYELKLNQYYNKFKPRALGSNYYLLLGDFLPLLERYLQTFLTLNRDYTSLGENLELNMNNVQFHLKKFDLNSNKYLNNLQVIPNSVKFKLISRVDESRKQQRKASYLSLNSATINLPSSLLVSSSSNSLRKDSFTCNKKTALNLVSKLNYRVASNVLILNLDQQEQQVFSTNDTSYFLIVDFALKNNYEVVYDEETNQINYKNLKTLKSDYYCAHLNRDINMWSTQNSRLISYDAQTNTIKCSYERDTTSGIYSIITPSSKFVNSKDAIAQPIYFSLGTKIVMPFGIIILFLTVLILLLFSKCRTALTVVYLNLCLNVLTMQLLFLAGINGNKSVVLCKFFAIVQHYFNLTSYLWILLIGLHLYRMLTELRDINKIGSCAPVFYYAIGYLTPIIIISLSLGIKQDVYTNYDTTMLNFYNAQSMAKIDLSTSVYCWLNVNNLNDILFVYILPISVTIVLFLIVCLLSYKELRKTSSFKQTDLKLVQSSLFGCLLILPFQIGVSVFVYLFLNSSTSILISSNYSVLYESLFILFSLVHSIVLFLIFVVFNKNLRVFLIKVWLVIKIKLKLANKLQDNKNNSLINKAGLTKKLHSDSNMLGVNQNNYNKANFLHSNEPSLLPKLNLNTQNMTTLERKNKSLKFNVINANYLLEYNQNMLQMPNHNISHSISTTTTSGDDTAASQFYNNTNMACAYMSHLANTTTTNTESTCSEFNSYNYQYDFSRPIQQQQQAQAENVRESDVVDVGKILKTRNMLQVKEEEEQHQQGNEDGNREIIVVENMNQETTVTTNQTDSEFVHSDQIKYVNVTDVIVKANENNLAIRKPSPLGLFWPNAIAECDSSFLEGSDVYTPAKLPYFNSLTRAKKPHLLFNQSLENNNSSGRCTSPFRPNFMQQQASAHNAPIHKASNCLNFKNNAVVVVSSDSANSSDNNENILVVNDVDNETRV